MSDVTPSTEQSEKPGEQENLSMLFAQLVMQQANMAMMLMGMVKNPQTGAVTKDLDAARLFIDELEMLEIKTKGNLNREESALLKQSLMNLRLAFVEAVEEKPSQSAASPNTPAEAKQSSTPAEAPASSADEEHRKKFSKKY